MAVLNPVESRTRWKMLARWLAGASTLIYVCSRFVPSRPPRFEDLVEDTYLHYFHTAFAQHLQFGRDVVYPFGPWALLYGGYDPATHWVTVLAWLGLSIVFWWVGWKAARHLLGNGVAAWIWFMAFTAVAGQPVLTMVDARLTAFLLLLWLLYFFVEADDRDASPKRPAWLRGRLGEASLPARVALIVALGLLSLSKVSVLVGSVLLLAIMLVDGLVRRRGLWMIPCFGASLLVFWVAARQDLRWFGPFIHSLRQHMSGYTEATMRTGPDPVVNAGCFLLAAGSVGAMGAYAIWKRDRFLGIFPISALGLLLFTAFKHGYVRHDCHEAAATLDLLLLALAVWASAWPVVRVRANQAKTASTLQPGRASVLAIPDLVEGERRLGSRGRSPCRAGSFAIAASFVPVTFILIFATVTYSRYYDTWLPTQFARTFSPSSLLGPARSLLNPGYMKAGYEAYLAGIRNATTVPPIDGPVDNYPGNGIALQARKLDYRPRPVMHSCAAYTPELAELNAAHLRSARAPENIMFQIIPIDGRFPSLEDGLSWPELLTRYDVREVQWPFVLLKQAAAPRSCRLVPLSNTSIRFGETVPVPGMSNGPIWATFEINRTLRGAFTSTLFKPPILWLSVVTHDGNRQRFRIIPGMAVSGFVLSPVIPNCWAFAELARTGGLGELAEKEVESLCLTADTDTGLTGCYHSTVSLRLYRMEYPGQDLDKLDGFRELNSVARMASRATVLHGDFAPSWDYLPSCGSVLRVAPNSAIQWSVEGHPKRLRLAFGIADAAPPVTEITARQPASSTLHTPRSAGVLFRVSAVGPQGALVPLWSQQFDAPGEQGGPNRRQAMVDLGNVPSSELVLETSPVGAQPTESLACYWSAIELE